MKQFILLCSLLVLAGCSAREMPINHMQDVMSPSSEYILSVPIEKAEDGHKYWFVTITDNGGVEVYKDVDTEFVGNLNVYWIWDEEDRVWLYSSDTGRTYVWIQSDSEWTKHFWGLGKNVRKYKENIKPPATLYPDYVNTIE